MRHQVFSFFFFFDAYFRISTTLNLISLICSSNFVSSQSIIPSMTHNHISSRIKTHIDSDKFVLVCHLLSWPDFRRRNAIKLVRGNWKLSGLKPGPFPFDCPPSGFWHTHKNFSCSCCVIQLYKYFRLPLRPSSSNFRLRQEGLGNFGTNVSQRHSNN